MANKKKAAKQESLNQQAKSQANTATSSANSPFQVRSQLKIQQLIDDGKLGVPIVKQLVEMSSVRPEDTVTMQAIAATLDGRLLQLGIDDQDLFHWLRACCLACYSLGNTDILRPTKAAP